MGDPETMKIGALPVWGRSRAASSSVALCSATAFIVFAAMLRLRRRA